MDFPQFDRVEYVENNGFMFQWCCKCKSRHIWHFHIVRGKESEDDYIEISCGRDTVAEKLRKFHEKYFKEKKEVNHGNKTTSNLQESRN